MAVGASTRFTNTTALSSANLNSVDVGGNVSVSDAGGLSVDVSALNYYVSGTPAYVTYAGVSGQAVTASQTNYMYILVSSGALTISTSAFPAAGTAHIRLAEVVCSGSAVTGITDKRPTITV
jgi:hypothetical protein